MALGVCRGDKRGVIASCSGAISGCRSPVGSLAVAENTSSRVMPGSFRSRCRRGAVAPHWCPLVRGPVPDLSTALPIEQGPGRNRFPAAQPFTRRPGPASPSRLPDGRTAFQCSALYCGQDGRVLQQAIFTPLVSRTSHSGSVQDCGPREEMPRQVLDLAATPGVGLYAVLVRAAPCRPGVCCAESSRAFRTTGLPAPVYFVPDGAQAQRLTPGPGGTRRGTRQAGRNLCGLNSDFRAFNFLNTRYAGQGLSAPFPLSERKLLFLLLSSRSPATLR